MQVANNINRTCHTCADDNCTCGIRMAGTGAEEGGDRRRHGCGRRGNARYSTKEAPKGCSVQRKPPCWNRGRARPRARQAGAQRGARQVTRLPARFRA